MEAMNQPSQPSAYNREDAKMRYPVLMRIRMKVEMMKMFHVEQISPVFRDDTECFGMFRNNVSTVSIASISETP